MKKPNINLKETLGSFFESHMMDIIGGAILGGGYFLLRVLDLPITFKNGQITYNTTKAATPANSSDVRYNPEDPTEAAIASIYTASTRIYSDSKLVESVNSILDIVAANPTNRTKALAVRTIGLISKKVYSDSRIREINSVISKIAAIEVPAEKESEE